MTVEENLAFGLRAHGMPKTQSRDRVLAVAAALGLTDYLTRRPRFLSGGQRQRVAMGRAIAREPSVFLMDEPLSNLDAKLRVQMRAEIMRIQRRLGTTTVYVTHDQTEALTMGDRIAVMRNGILQQVGTPYEVYESPANLFVAEFIGSPSMNLASGRIRLVDGLVSFEIGAHRWELPESVTRMYPSLLERDGQEIILGIRPENVGLVTSVPHGDAIRMATTAELVESVGSDVYVHFSIEAPPVQSLELIEIARDIGASGVEKLAESAGQTEFIARCPAEVNIQAGQAITLVMRSERIHFFDRDSGDAVRRSVERIQS
jgi:multiple sugar transport system ATP-binding protein